MLYTSGTTGKPKGVCQTHAAFISAARGGVQVDRMTRRRRHPLLPADGLGRRSPVLLRPGAGGRLHDQLPGVGRHGDDRPARNRPDLLLCAAAGVREPADLGDDPHGRCRRSSSARCSITSWMWPSAAARTFSTASRSALGDRLQYWLGNILVYGPLRNVLGMSRIRVAYTAGAAIGPELFSFYRSIGINLKQLYGQTETCAYVCLQPDGQVKSDTVGAAGAGRRNQDRRQRRGAGQGADAAQGILQAPGRHGRVDQCRRLLHDRRCRLPRRGRPPEDHRPRQGCRQAVERRDVRPQLHREQAQVLPAHQGSGLLRPRPRHGLRLRQYRRRRGRQLGRAARHRLFRLHRSGRQAGGAAN